MTTPLAKLDVLSRRLLEGAELKTHKYFRVAVPQALTGTSLVALLVEQLFQGIADGDLEAEHLATILVQYGYLFPVIEEVKEVKQDGTLYRLQRPYFWPSHATQTDNVEYAIYLNKRLLRNEQKHGLEDDEAESYNRLAELLAHMWGFITQQAEMQLKHQKEKKKADKVVYDSEERAFWRSRRPGPNKYLEQPMHKLERRIRKTTVQGYKNTIERLKFNIKTKPWLKALKASDTMVSWVEQRVDYDPFLSPPVPGGNPWVTEDQSFWILNSDSVEIPTELRVKRWGLSVHELVRDSMGRQVLETFLESEYSSENIRFWLKIQELKLSPNKDIYRKSQAIYDEFLGPNAASQVNVDNRTLDQTVECLRKANTDAAKRHAFTHSEEHVFTLMAKDSYPRFVRSQIYKAVLSAAQQQDKKGGWRNFLFSMGGGKKPMPVLTNKQPKVIRDESSLNALPKQLSSDSLPVRQSHVRPEPSE
ncbi:unnamed protein product [Auanema sp. JU1783]|nr:unnamed protein product [Auanema sp. JU1783]